MDNTTTNMIPKELSDLIANPATFETVEKIGVKFGLNRVEIGLLAQVTGSLLVGEISPNQFIATLVDYLTVPQEKAMLIAQEINRDIFNSVKEALKQLHNVAQEKGAEKPAAAVSTPQQAVAAPKTVAAQKPSTQNTPIPEAQPKIAVGLKPSVPFGAIPEAAAGKTESNNLESKLGGAFTIKKDVMFTAPSAPASPLQPAASPASVNKPSAPLPQAAITAPSQAKTLDPYRELPS